VAAHQHEKLAAAAKSVALKSADNSIIKISRNKPRVAPGGSETAWKWQLGERQRNERGVASMSADGAVANDVANRKMAAGSVIENGGVAADMAASAAPGNNSAGAISQRNSQCGIAA
jgi:hypothetical protein